MDKLAIALSVLGIVLGALATCLSIVALAMCPPLLPPNYHDEACDAGDQRENSGGGADNP